MMIKLRAFTLIEVLVVMVILGALASLGLVRYAKSIRQAYEREAVHQLMSLHSANEIYYSRAKSYLGPTGSLNLTQVNQGLGLNIVTNGPLTYRYWSAGPGNYQAYADYAGSQSFSIQIEQGNITWTTARLLEKDYFGKKIIDQLASFFDFMVTDAHAIIPYNNPCCASSKCPSVPPCQVVYH